MLMPGSQPPHRNSIDLVRMAMEANGATGKFVIDSLWDRPTHPEGWYFRSDHVPYAGRSVPSIFFSTNLHSDCHTPRDEPKNIDHSKLTRMTQWMYMTGWIAANGAIGSQSRELLALALGARASTRVRNVFIH